MQELGALWERILDGLQGNDPPGTAQSILTFAYFWYNFMPLARGTAAAGYILILSMFLAAGMPVSASIPKVRRLHRPHTRCTCLLLCKLPLRMLSNSERPMMRLVPQPRAKTSSLACSWPLACLSPPASRRCVAAHLITECECILLK